MSCCPNFSIIVAHCQNGGIGYRGKIPWNVPADLRHFQIVTTTTKQLHKENAIIMGRKTWASLPRKPLPNRRNIVISKTLASGKGFEVYPSLDDALEFLGQDDFIERIFVIGGSQLYKESLEHPSCKYAFVTVIGQEYECDAFFPTKEFLKDDWNVVHTTQVLRTEDGTPYVFTQFVKNN